MSSINSQLGKFYDQLYDLLNMLLREHISYMYATHQIYRYPELLADTVINSIPLIFFLQTLRFLESFPLDIMYLFYQDIISQVLVKMFARTFWADQDISQSDNKMKIPQDIWIWIDCELAVYQELL